MVAVDDQLEGIRMRLRQSMCKYSATDDAEAEIEIAKAFHSPSQMYLNR